MQINVRKHGSGKSDSGPPGVMHAGWPAGRATLQMNGDRCGRALRCERPAIATPAR